MCLVCLVCVWWVWQVKIRGYRVELSEIESVMCEHSGVKSAVVDVQVRGPSCPSFEHPIALPLVVARGVR
jgi:hypothetical protein